MLCFAITRPTAHIVLHVSPPASRHGVTCALNRCNTAASATAATSRYDNLHDPRKAPPWELEASSFSSAAQSNLCPSATNRYTTRTRKRLPQHAIGDFVTKNIPRYGGMQPSAAGYETQRHMLMLAPNNVSRLWSEARSAATIEKYA